MALAFALQKNMMMALVHVNLVIIVAKNAQVIQLMIVLYVLITLILDKI